METASLLGQIPSLSLDRVFVPLTDVNKQVTQKPRETDGQSNETLRIDGVLV